MLLHQVKLPHFKHSAESETVTLPLPDKVVISMAQHLGAPCTPTVKVGDKVKIGDVIGSSEAAMSAPVHSSISGTVTAIEKRLVPNGTISDCIIIKNDGENRRRDEPFQPVILMLRFFLFRCCFGFGRIFFYAETAFCDLFDYHFGRDLAFVVADDELACGQIDIGAFDSVQLARDALDGTAAGGTRHTRNTVFFLSHILPPKYPMRVFSTNIIARIFILSSGKQKFFSIIFCRVLRLHMRACLNILFTKKYFRLFLTKDEKGCIIQLV